MKIKKAKFWVIIFLIIISLVTGGCSSQTPTQGGIESKGESKYPQKPITLLVGFDAGGPSDAAARIIAPYLEKELGQPVVIENKPGSAGELSYNLLASSKPDGYTLGIINLPNIVAMPLNHETTFKLDDLAWIGNTSFDENVIAVKADGKYKTLEDLINAAKKNPKGVTIGDSGPMGDDQLAAMVFADNAGVQFKDTPFKGTGPSIVALLGGHIDAVVSNAVDVIEQVKSGEMVVLATMGDKPNPDLPGVPTLKDKGFDVTMATYRSIAASAKTPPEILEKLRTALSKASENPEAIEAANKAKLPIVYMSQGELNKVVEDTDKKLKPLNLDKLGQ